MESPKRRVVKKKLGKKSESGVERVPTGIKNFDSLIEGGLARDSTNLLVGGTGSGKTIFAMQFMVEGISKGEACLFITFEEKKKEFYENMAEFGWDLQKLEDEGKFEFLEYTPEKVRTMLEEGGGIIESIILKKNVQRVVIDSITSFELLFNEDVEKREAALLLFDMLRKWDCTSLLTYEGRPAKDKTISSRILEFESDSIILLYYVRKGKKRDRYVEVLKMRGTKHSRSVYPFIIDETGIAISKDEFTGEL